MLEPIYMNNPYIGLVDTTVIAPPHTVSALVECICKKENKGVEMINWESDIDLSITLFKTISSSKPYPIQDSISLLGEDRPGSDPENPVILKIIYQGMHKCSFLNNLLTSK